MNGRGDAFIDTFLRRPIHSCVQVLGGHERGEMLLIKSINNLILILYFPTHRSGDKKLPTTNNVTPVEINACQSHSHSDRDQQQQKQNAPEVASDPDRTICPE